MHARSTTPNPAAAVYTFQKLTRADYPLIRTWLSHPHINGWWGDGETEIALMEEDMANGPTDMRLVCLNETPFAYVQDYPAHHWPAPHFADLPEGTRAMDTFLGDPTFLGKGHAARYLRERAHALHAAGAARVVVDPDAGNEHAIRTYKAAGFAGDQILPCEDGALVRVMIFEG